MININIPNKKFSEMSKEELETIVCNEYKQNSTTSGVTISGFEVGDVESEGVTCEKVKSIEVKLKPEKAKIEVNIEFE